MNLPSILTRNVRLPVIGAPMFIASTPELVIEQCKAGIIGSLPALNARPQSLLEEWIVQIQAALAEHDTQHPDQPAAPFAINQISHPSNDRLQADTDIIAKTKVPIVIVSLHVSKEICDQVHSYGGIVLNDVISNKQAKKSVKAGVDGLVAVAAGAGGHTGNISPFALVSEIREWWDGPLALSGAIANGQNILAALATGADFAYIGSSFLATNEANTQPAYKQMIVDGTARDIITSDAFSGVPANFLIGSIVNSGLDPKNLQRDPNQAINISESSASHKTWTDIWGCGQGINAIKQTVSTATLIKGWKEQYHAARQQFITRFAD
jgi:nitronate monooxygenase|tara:strand:- start:2986 stop:3957 length:972 start_codon:yes stop_codon:yes gene_type:complete